jgi:hypothetical protein
MRTRFFALLLFLAALVGMSSRAVFTANPRFYRDDPLQREIESQDASAAQRSDIGDLYEMTYNLFVTPRYKPTGLRAKNLNTIDEVPDSSWFTNRVVARTLTIDELVRGPVAGAPPDPSSWVIIREKSVGVHPGITAKDANGESWFLEFDPKYYPEAATAAVVMATKFFWALGYNQVESFMRHRNFGVLPPSSLPACVNLQPMPSSSLTCSNVYGSAADGPSTRSSGDRTPGSCQMVARARYAVRACGLLRIAAMGIASAAIRTMPSVAITPPIRASRCDVLRIENRLSS